MQLVAPFLLDRAPRYNPLRDPRLAAAYDFTDSTKLVVNASNRVSFARDVSGNSGTLGLVLPGTSGNYASTPDSAALSITGDIDLRIYCAMNSWTPAAETALIAKWVGAQNSYLLRVTTAGNAKLYGSPDGSTTYSATSSVVIPGVAYAGLWVRATRASASGNVLFYTSADGVSWTQLGTQQSTTAGAIFDSTSIVEIGSNSGGINANFTGTIYRAQIYNGIAGTLAFDANFTACTYGLSNAATFVESSSNAATVTINGSGALGSRIQGARDLSMLTGSAQPLLLPWSGTNYVWNANVASNTVSAPNKSVTGNQTFAFNFQLDDYTPASNITLLDKLSGNNGFQVLLLTTGVIRLRVGDGAAVTNVDSTAANTLTDAAQGTIGIVWTDGVGASFTQNGSALGTSVAAAKTLTNAAVALTVGPWAGRIYSITVGSVYSLSAADATNNASSWTASTGEVWTVASTGSKPAQVVGKQSLLFDGSAYYMRSAAFTLNQPETVVLVGKRNAWTANDAIWDGVSSNGMLFYSPTDNTKTQMYSGAFGPVISAWTLGTNGVVQAIYNGASSSLRLNRNTAATGNVGSNNAGGFQLAQNFSSGINFSAIQVTRVLIFSTALDTATLDRLAIWCGKQDGITV